MSSFNNNYFAELMNNAMESHRNAMEQIADLCDGGRKWRKSAIKKGVNKYSNPDYIEACRTDARRSIAIWSKY